MPGQSAHQLYEPPERMSGESPSRGKATISWIGGLLR